MRKDTPQERYDKENTIRVSLKLNKRYDRDILEYLDKSGNKQGTIKAALREKMVKKTIKEVSMNREAKIKKIGSLRMKLPETGYIWTEIRYNRQKDAVIYARRLCRLPSGRVKCLWMRPVKYLITDEKGNRLRRKFNS